MHRKTRTAVAVLAVAIDVASVIVVVGLADGTLLDVAGVFQAGAGGRIYARIEDVQEAMGLPGMASFCLVKARSSGDTDAVTRLLQEQFQGYKVTPVTQVSQLMKQNTVGLQQFEH